MDFEPLIERIRERFSELEVIVTDSNLFANPQRAREYLQEHARLRSVLEKWDELVKARRELSESQSLASSDDPEIREMAQAEVEELSKHVPNLEFETQVLLLPPEGTEDRDAIMEIRAGTGGDEAAIFAGDLLRMYSRFAERSGLKLELLESSPSDMGGFREVVFKVSGKSVFSVLRYESGVHRVQRVPATEAQGRIHTSTATVAVLPEAEEVDIQIKPEDLRIEVCRAGGPGGQGVNTTDSAVQVLHIPTGKIVRCQDGRSQQKNKEKALKILRSRLLEEKQREEAEKYSSHRRELIGSGGREEKIRTYNFPQNRVTDHRIGLTLYSLDLFIDGDLEDTIQALRAADLHARMEEASTAAATATPGTAS